MAQWIKVLWNNSFVNLMRLPLLCEKTGALAIVEPGLMVHTHTYAHSFKSYFSWPFDRYNNGLIPLPKVQQSAFIEASFTGLSGIHGCSGGLKMAPTCRPGRHPAGNYYKTNW